MTPLTTLLAPFAICYMAAMGALFVTMAVREPPLVRKLGTLALILAGCSLIGIALLSAGFIAMGTEGA